jgi:Icc-related predicted phosphoesterase
MRCLLLSDLHYALKQFDWATRVAGEYDTVIVAGDHLDVSSAVDPRAQIVVILKYLRQLKEKTRVIACSGNHDLDTRGSEGEKIARWMHRVRALGIPTDGDSLEVDGTLFTICPWWDGPQSCRGVGEQLAKDAGRPKERWIWVYHAPPSASPTSWNGKQHFGDDELVKWIDAYQPDLVLTGHIHQSPFAREGSWVDRRGRTWIFNSGRQIGESPAHIVFDTVENQAIWFSQAGVEAVFLDEPLTRPVAEITELPLWLRP